MYVLVREYVCKRVHADRRHLMIERRPSKHKTIRISKQTRTTVFALVVIIVIAFGSIAQNRFLFDSHSLRVWFFDIGQGDGTLIETPSGKKILVDAGPDASILMKLGEVLWPWDRSLDAIVITHPDADHITGFVSVLRRYRVGHVYETGVIAKTAVDTEIEKLIREEQLPVTIVRIGDSIPDADVKLALVWPNDVAVLHAAGDRNNASVVIRLSYGETTALLTGDAEEPSEKLFAPNVGPVDVLKVGHHGSATATSQVLLDLIRPRMAVISVGVQNKYGHPHPLILDRLMNQSIQIFRTDLQGDILMTSDSGEPMVRAYPLLF